MVLVLQGISWSVCEKDCTSPELLIFTEAYDSTRRLNWPQFTVQSALGVDLGDHNRSWPNKANDLVNRVHIHQFVMFALFQQRSCSIRDFFVRRLFSDVLKCLLEKHVAYASLWEDKCVYEAWIFVISGHAVDRQHISVRYQHESRKVEHLLVRLVKQSNSLVDYGVPDSRIYQLLWCA